MHWSKQKETLKLLLNVALLVIKRPFERFDAGTSDSDSVDLIVSLRLVARNLLLNDPKDQLKIQGKIFRKVLRKHNFQIFKLQ